MGFKEWFKEPPPKKPRMGTRVPAPQFVAIHPTDHNTTEAPIKDIAQDQIKDISATGIYILTKDRWENGTPVPLTLHRSSLKDELDEANDLTLPATAVRSGQDGVGLQFELPNDIDPKSWVSLVEGAVGEAGPDNIVEQFKMAEAAAFLDRICPQAEKDFRRRICSDLSSGRFKHAIDIALKAERILAGWPDGETMHANPALLARILEFGSWAEELRTQELWAGLLAIACTPENDHEENLDLVERLGQFAAVHFRIFTVACAQSSKFISDTGEVAARPLVYSSEEVMNIGGSRDLGRVERDLQHLHDLGFFMSKNVPSSYVPVVELNLAPTSLGLKVYARMHAHRGALETFYAVAAPVAQSR